MLTQTLVIGCFILLWILCAAASILIIALTKEDDSNISYKPISTLKRFVLATILIILAPIFLVVAIFDFFVGFVKV